MVLDPVLLLMLLPLDMEVLRDTSLPSSSEPCPCSRAESLLRNPASSLL